MLPRGSYRGEGRRCLIIFVDAPALHYTASALRCAKPSCTASFIGTQGEPCAMPSYPLPELTVIARTPLCSPNQ